MIYIDPTATEIGECSVLFQNVLAQGTLTASTETDDGFAENALGPQTYDAWVPSAMPATLSVVLAAAQECDTAAIYAHTLGTAGATVFLEYWNGSSWITVQTLTPTDDTDIVFIFGHRSSAQWRFRITGATAPALGILMIGLRLIIPDGVIPDYTPVYMNLTIEALNNKTQGGQYRGARIRRTGAGTDIKLAAQSRYWVENTGRDFINHFNNVLPFVWMPSPDLLPRDGCYCWRIGDVMAGSFDAGAVRSYLSMEVAGYVGS